MANDKYYGTDGDDTYDGGEGHDTILGDAGDDTLTGGEGYDRIRGGSGDDTIYGGDDIDILRGDSGDDEIYGGEGKDTILGDEGDDEIYGGAGNDTILGGGGDDTLTGGAGEDTFVYSRIEAGDDTIKDFNVDEDTIDLSLLPETITYDQLTIEDNADGDAVVTISKDHLGTDATENITITLEGVTASDLSADNFNMPDPPVDSLSTDTGHSLVKEVNPWEGTDANNVYFANSSDTQMLAYGGNDTIYGGEGDDEIYGGDGCDLLMGEEGDDTLDGGADADVLVGGSGDDTFVFQADHGNDTIKDFEDGNDTIDLTAFSSITGFSQLTISDNDDGDAVIDLSSFGGGEITLEGTSSSDLDASDFDFYMI